MTGHVTEGLSDKNLATHSLVIFTPDFAGLGRAHSTQLHYDMRITLSETFNESQPSISLGLDPPSLESSPTYDNLTAINRIEAMLLDCEDFQIDQEVELTTLLDTPELPVYQRVSYKQMANFGTSKIPLLIVAGSDMECGEAGPNRNDSSLSQKPGSTTHSPRSSSKVDGNHPTVPGEPVPDPVDLQLSVKEEQVILVVRQQNQTTPMMEETMSRPWCLELPQRHRSQRRELRTVGHLDPLMQPLDCPDAHMKMRCVA